MSMLLTTPISMLSTANNFYMTELKLTWLLYIFISFIFWNTHKIIVSQMYWLAHLTHLTTDGLLTH